MTQSFLVDGPVTPELAATEEEELGGELGRPRVVFTYTNWDPASPEWAYEYKEAAYSVLEGFENTPQGVDFEAVDCDEPAAARLCGPPFTGNRTPPGVVVFHAGGPDDRAVSVADLAAVRAAAGPAQWAAAVKLAGWLREEIERYAVPPEEEGGGAGDGGESGGEEEGAPSGEGAGDDGAGGGKGGFATVDFMDGGGEGGGDAPPAEPPAVADGSDDGGAGGAPPPPPASPGPYTSENGDFGTPAPSLSSSPGYSFTPDAEPDPEYEPAGEDDNGDDADYAARREAWEQHEGGDGGGEGDGDGEGDDGEWEHGGGEGGGLEEVAVGPGGQTEG